MQDGIVYGNMGPYAFDVIVAGVKLRGQTCLRFFLGYLFNLSVLLLGISFTTSPL